jgi:MEMO1 family protein
VKLAALRRDLELLPSPVEDRPGLLIRDPFHYADSMIIVPPPIVPCLVLFDGDHELSDLRELLYRLSGSLDVGHVAQTLQETLSGGGFLEDDGLALRRENCQRTFANAPQREAAFAGSGYPEEPGALRDTVGGYLRQSPAEPTAWPGLLGVAAPHASPWAGAASYGAAYAALPPELSNRTFVVLGTSHYGEPERFGITRKPYVTPFGPAGTDSDLVEQLIEGGGSAVTVEDYCHRLEHSIEFQVVFLQHVFGPQVRVVPVLCGAFVNSLLGPGRPEDDPEVARFFAVLERLRSKGGDEIFWVLGVDMAHVGRRYGDRHVVAPGDTRMASVEAADRERCSALAAGDASAFWSLVQKDADPIRWCGSSPLYTFLHAIAPRSGNLLHYEQWAIDPQSVVTFGAMTFTG